MSSTPELQQKVFAAARDQGINSVLFRNAIGRKLGLNVTDSECLSLLAIKGVATAKELSHYSGLSSGSTTAMLDRLEKRGLITRRPNPADRRGVLIEISKEYMLKSQPLVVGVQKAHRELLAGYTDTELEVIADFLTRFTNNVVEHTKKLEQEN